jgi:hypothetical protein
LCDWFLCGLFFVWFVFVWFGLVWLCPLRWTQLQLDSTAQVPSGTFNIGTSLSICCWTRGALHCVSNPFSNNPNL